jgi:hypothetical protein
LAVKRNVSASLVRPDSSTANALPLLRPIGNSEPRAINIVVLGMCNIFCYVIRSLAF